MTPRVELTLSCSGLRDADVFSKSDPLITVFDEFNNELGRTECIDNDLNPTFKEKIILQYNSDEFQKLIFKVWDIDDNENDISKADFLGDMDCTLQELVDCSTFSKPLRYEGSDFGKIFIKTEMIKEQPQKGGKKGKKGKKGGNKKKETVINETVTIKTETMDEVDDTFKSCGGGGDETIGEGGVGLHSDTMMTQGFTPTDRYTPTSDHENKEVDHDNKQGDYDNKFIPVRHPLRPVAGADGYLSDPGVNDSNDNYKSMTGFESKPYHFIPTRTSLYDMSLTPLEDISCITPQDACITQQDISPGTKSTIKQRPDNDTYGHLTGEYVTTDERDTYEELQSLAVVNPVTPSNTRNQQHGVPLSRGVPKYRSHDGAGGGKAGGGKAGGGVHTGTSMTPAAHRATSNTGTSPIWLEDQVEAYTQMSPPKENGYISHHNNANNWVSPRQITSPPAHPPSIHNIPSSELRWCKFSSADSSAWESHYSSSSTPPPPPPPPHVPLSEENKTLFYSFTDSNRQAGSTIPTTRRPPVLQDFESSWDDVLNDSNTPDWSAVDTRQWRTWFEFYKANSKVKKMRSLLVGTMMGTRECVIRGSYQTTSSNTATPDNIPATPHSNTSNSNLVHSTSLAYPGNSQSSPAVTARLPVIKPSVLIEDKSILHQCPPVRFNETHINVINVDPIQVCLHLQNNGYEPGLFVPGNPHTPGGEWRIGGTGPLEEFIRRSNYYSCVDPVDSPIEEGSKRSGSLGLLGPTECQINTNVTVFRESQQRNYLFFAQPKLLHVFSVTPLPKVKRGPETQSTLSKEEVRLLKRKLSILIYSAATHGADCLVLTPHLTEGRRVPHRHIAEIVQGVVNKHQGLLKRVIVAIERDVIFHDISKEILSVYNKHFPDGHITLPSLSPLPKSQDILLWHWMGDNNNWYPYDPRQNEVIDAIYLRGESKMSMKGTDTTHPGYLVDFNHFTVKSLSSGASRKIGRFRLVYDKIVKKSSSRPMGNWVSASEETGKLYETAVEDPLPLDQPLPVWQWLSDDNTWTEYTPKQSDMLEEAYLQHGTACVILHVLDTRFSVNTKSRIQTNTRTGKQRKVQRIVRSVRVSPPPRATSTPTPPEKQTRSVVEKTTVVWEHQGSDMTWLPFDPATTDLMEAAYGEGKPRLTVVFNNQAYWIYFEPYYVLVDPNINEEYAIRRAVSQKKDIKPIQLFPQSLVTPKQPAKVPVTPMSNSTMIDQTMCEPAECNQASALFTTASDFSAVMKDVQPANSTELNPKRERSLSADSIKYDANQNRMQKTFLRHPSVQVNRAGNTIPYIHRTASLTSTLSSSRDVISPHDVTLPAVVMRDSSRTVRDPSREFAWEWEDSRTGLWHTLPEFVSCFLEPASKIQSHGGVRTSKLTNGSQQITVRADFNSRTITGHLPGRPDIVSRLRRVEVC